MLKYTVIYERDTCLYPATLKASTTVEQLIAEGWTLQGGHSIMYDPIDNYFVVSQALVREEDYDEE